MHTGTRLKLDMAGRAMEFCRAHPDETPVTAQVATRLGDLVTRAGMLAQLQRTNLVVASAAVSQKTDLRRSIEDSLVALVGIARAASVEHPDIPVHRRPPRKNANEATFITAARVAVAEATAIKAVLEPFGLTDALVQTLITDLDSYDEALGRQRNALATQVGAGADLRAVVGDIMAVVRNIDALNRVRFRKVPELRAAWKSARNVAWPHAEPEPVVQPAPDIPRAA